MSINHAAMWVAVGTLIVFLSSGMTPALETQSGNEDLQDADATSGEKEKSQIGLAGGEAINCRFQNRGTPAADNAAYYGCLMNGLTSFEYSTSYSNPSSGAPTMNVLSHHPGGFNSIIDGLCYAESDLDIDWISIKTTANPDLRAKIRNFSTPAGDGTIRVYLNEEEVVELETEIGMDVTAQLQTLIDAHDDFVVLDGIEGGYIVIAGEGEIDVYQVGITSTDSDLYQTEIALEENDYESTYCPGL